MRLSDYPPWNLSLPLDSLGLAAIYNVKGHWVAQKQLLQLTQMWDWLWRDRTKMFWCTKDEPYLDLLSECINDVCVQRKSALQHKAKHNKPANLFSNSQFVTVRSNLNEVKRMSNLNSKVSPCNCLSRHCSNIFKWYWTLCNKAVLLQLCGRRQLAAVSDGGQNYNR